MGNRNGLDIYADILHVALSGAKKTEIVYKANLNFVLADRYLRSLIDKGLIEKSDKFFTTTPDGNRFVEQYRNTLACARL